MNQEYNKTPINQAQITSFYSEPVSQVKRKRRTRLELANLTSKERSDIYGNRSSLWKIKRQRKQILTPYLSDRKLLDFLAPFCVPIERKRGASNELYIYNLERVTRVNKVTTKKIEKIVSSDIPPWGVWGTNGAFKKTKKRKFWSNRMQFDNESQPKYLNDSQTSQKEERRESKSLYKDFIPEKLKPAEDFHIAAQRANKILVDPEYESFRRIMGSDLPAVWAGMIRHTTSD